MRKYDYLILLLLAQPVWGLNSHPRIWLDSATRSTLAAKFASGDPDWAQVKAYADIALSKPFQVMTIVSATNSNPVQFTIQGNMPIPTGVVFYLGGGTGAWAAVNKPGRSAGYWTATVTGARTFTLPIDSTSFGPLTGNLVGFPASGCLTGFTCYDYEGAGWQESIEPLAIAYKVTGNTAYAYKALAWMDYVNSLGAAGIDGPESTDSGYPSRSAVLTLGLVYDWCYDQLNYDGNGAARKAATAVTASLWFNWMQSNAWFGPAPTSNYWAGHILGFGVLGYATQGDNPNAQTLIDWATTQWNTYAVPGLTPAAPGTSTGRLYSGVMPGTHYDAPYTWPWTAMYMLTRATAGDTALPNYSAVANKMARALIYDLKPDRWAIRRDGVQTGSVTGVFSGIGPLALAHFLTQYAANADDSLKGGWMQWQFQHFGTAPNGTGNLLLNNKIAPHNYVERLLFYWPNRQAIDYAQTEPTYFYAPSDQPRIFWRSDWSTAADWLMFNASQHFISSGTGDTQIAGELDINRGTDYLIVNGQNWFGSGDGTSGLSSAGGIYTGNDLASTLYFNDGGLCARGIPGGQWGGGAYAGDPLNNLTPTYGYARADLTTPYKYNCSGTMELMLSSIDPSLLRQPSDNRSAGSLAVSALPSLPATSSPTSSARQRSISIPCYQPAPPSILSATRAPRTGAPKSAMAHPIPISTS
jgi:hypothetical protein